MGMGTDLLAGHRKATASPVDAFREPAEREEYLAFATAHDPFCLEIRSSADSADSPGYNILLAINHDRELGTHFTLMFSIMVVHVRGKNLKAVVYALQRRKAEFLEVFDPKKFPKPADDMPIIHSIEIRWVENGSLSKSGNH